MLIVCPRCQHRADRPGPNDAQDGPNHCDHCGEDFPPVAPAAKPDWRSLRREWLASSYMAKAKPGVARDDAETLYAIAPHRPARPRPGEVLSTLADMPPSPAAVMPHISDFKPDFDDMLSFDETAESESPRAIRVRQMTSLKPRRRGFGKMLANILPGARACIVLAAGLALVALITFRQQIVGTEPAMASLYSAVGFNVNLRGLAFSDMTTSRTRVDGAPVLVVQGVITNVTGRTIDVPQVKLTIQDRQGAAVYGWIASPSKTSLGAGETLAFRSRLASPPEGDSVAVRFARSEDFMLTSTRSASASIESRTHATGDDSGA